MWKGILSLLFIVPLFSAEAKSLELKKNSKSIYLEEKKAWVLGKDIFGMPFIYFSPLVNGQRSNISFTDTGAELELDYKSLSRSQDMYRVQKKRWAEKVGAMPLGFQDHEVSINKHGHRIHSVGFSFEHEHKRFVERSYYIECRGKVLFSKSLRLEENFQHEKDFSDLLSGLDCGGV